MNENDSKVFPRVYRSPRADAFYEQCLWDRGHVDAIYPVLNGQVVADGGWHEIPLKGKKVKVGRYRVFNRQYFQAVFAKRPNHVFEALAAMDAVETEDDAEWAIWSRGADAGYAMSSTFAVTPGQFAHQPEVDEWLWRHGLGLEPNEHFVEGAAYFTDIQPGCMRDAMERLRWLENAFADLEQRLDQAGRGFWEELRAESDAALSKLRGSIRPDEIAPLPDRYPRQGWKRREATLDAGVTSEDGPAVDGSAS